MEIFGFEIKKRVAANSQEPEEKTIKKRGKLDNRLKLLALLEPESQQS